MPTTRCPRSFLLSSLITTRKPRRLMEYDDDGFEDLENEIISGEPSPYDIRGPRGTHADAQASVHSAPDPQLPLS